jgi:mono/diheme cytochrome c family protein
MTIIKHAKLILLISLASCVFWQGLPLWRGLPARAQIASANLWVTNPTPQARAGSPRHASPTALQVSFERDIRPLLLARCSECHVTAKQMAGLRFDQKSSAMKVITPGKSDASELIRRVTSNDRAEMMPPKGERLTPREIALLKAWIDAGAQWPETETNDKRADQTWWSLQPLANPEPPLPKNIPAAWSKSPIDRFVYAQLAERNLSPSSPADRRTLMRRVTYDLTGLPPTPEEVEAFVNDKTPNTYEKLVDRLLASPRYGEQWGRHWLDVARFGESKGYEQNHLINSLWRYRDYVIRSFNDDKPFNRFIVEQLAGDVVGRGDPAVEIGTAFLVCGPYDAVNNQDEVQQKIIRANTLDDLITATSNAFLGLTVNCARCHHHKFDPIPTEDYYRLRAAFEGVTHGERVLATEAEKQSYAAKTKPLETRRAALTKEKAALDQTIAARAKDKAAQVAGYPLPKITRHFNEHRFAPVAARYLKFKMLAHSDNPKSAANGRIDEFEVWTNARNVALASNGGKAKGVTTRRAEDVAGAEAYGVDLVNDGKFGERWFVSNPAELTIEFAHTETIERIVFSHDRTATPDTLVSGIGPFVTEYQILISRDGHEWQTVADSSARPPFNEAHLIERFARAVTTAEEKQKLQTLEAELAQINRELKAVAPLPLAWIGKFDQPKETTYVHKGGDPLRRGADVVPASLAVLSGALKPFALPADAPEAERRLALANWIASDDNPLTARVLANRVWHYHFGTGLVDTPSDFGALGGKPSHPTLLDWLARRLQAHGWRLKPLHREILLSQTYQQSGAHRDEAARLDASTRLLWRFPPRRLRAEEIRDTLLAVTGKLNLQMGGAGFRLYRYLEDNVATYVPLDQHDATTFRRAVYHQNARSSLIDGLTDFDLPDNAGAAPSRITTTSPLQALTLLNHQFTLTMADALAERVKREIPNDEAAQVRRAFALAFQRQVTREEETAARQLIQQYGWRAFGRALLNANELLYVN